MAHLCKNTVEAYWFGDVPKGYWFEDHDLENAIIVAEDFLSMGEEPLWLSGYDLNAFIRWCRLMLRKPKGFVVGKKALSKDLPATT